MVKLTIKGQEQLNAAFADMDKRLQRVGLIKAVKAGSAIIKADMEDRAPYDPNSRHKVHLRDSITTKFTKRGIRRSEQAIGPDTRTAWRAGWQEFGTAHQSAEPFMLPALEDNSAEAQRAAGDELWNSIKQGTK